MAELKEVSAILDTLKGKVELEDLQSALQAILFHQCLYEDWPHAPSYRLLARHLANVQPILAAFGYSLRHHPVAHMLVLEPSAPVFGLQMSRLKKDETAVLIVLRLLYEEGITALDEQGRVETTTDDIHDRLKTCGEEPPPIVRLLDILRMFQRKGLVRVGEHDAVEQLTALMIMPGITILVSDVYVEGVTQWLEARALERLDRESAMDAKEGKAAPEAGDDPPYGSDTDLAGGESEGDAERITAPPLAPDILAAIAEHRAHLGTAATPGEKTSGIVLDVDDRTDGLHSEDPLADDMLADDRNDEYGSDVQT
jgi:hypothetical protein